MGCTFCATGGMPVVGDLDAAEIVEQVLHAHALEVAAGRPPVRNAVFMGMGEPLNNYASVLQALRTLVDNACLGRYALPQCRVTVSTVGVVPRMLQLAEDMPGVNLALSLHAPTQALREQIVPAAKHHPLPELLAALDAHAARCRRHSPTSVATMVEYVLLDGINDDDACALELGQLMAPRAKDVMVNLIPYNAGAKAAFAAPPHRVVERFQQLVAACGVTVRVRREMGRDIAGACGQLALSSSQAAGPITAEADVEDFVAWRRQRPRSEKAAVHAECSAAAAAAAAASAAAPAAAGAAEGLAVAAAATMTAEAKLAARNSMLLVAAAVALGLAAWALAAVAGATFVPRARSGCPRAPLLAAAGATAAAAVIAAPL